MDPYTIPADCVVFDTETTGFDPDEGDRLVEVGAVRMRDGLPTDETFHRYINPQRSVPQAAVEVHGLTAAFLADKPFFEEVAQDFLDFVGDLPLVAHNARFDAKFINFQLAEIGLPLYEEKRFIDSVPIARRTFPGQQVNLDALCRKLKISLDKRDKHGALIDSQLLAEVCVELMGGRQASLFGDISQEQARQAEEIELGPVETVVLYATDEERARHAKLVAELGPDSIWARYQEAAA